MKKILHISHHTGCLDDLEWVASSLGCSIDTLKYPYGYNIGKVPENYLEIHFEDTYMGTTFWINKNLVDVISLLKA